MHVARFHLGPHLRQAAVVVIEFDLDARFSGEGLVVALDAGLGVGPAPGHDGQRVVGSGNGARQQQCCDGGGEGAQAGSRNGAHGGWSSCGPRIVTDELIVSLTLPMPGSIIRPPFRFGQFTGYGAVW